VAAHILGVSQDELSPPFACRYPPGLLTLVAIGVICAAIVWRQKSKTRGFHVRLRAVAEDPRYQRAIAILDEYVAQQEAAETPSHGFQSADGTAAHREPTTPNAEYASTSEADTAAFEMAVEHLVAQGIDRPEAATNLPMLVHVMAASST
jgi:hypothetical protein